MNWIVTDKNKVLVNNYPRCNSNNTESHMKPIKPFCECCGADLSKYHICTPTKAQLETYYKKHGKPSYENYIAYDGKEKPTYTVQNKTNNGISKIPKDTGIINE